MASVYRDAEIREGRELAATIGLDSYSPEWMRECEIRSLAVKDKVTLEAFFAGVTSKRGRVAAKELISLVRERQSAMEVMRISHPFINMTVFRSVHTGEPIQSTEISQEVALQPQQEATSRRQPMFPRR